ncbi:MAG: hypothetical protein JWO53_1156, partial [Chlamydiia bacterium]|nr:hypothetical protein [Chlamydiia bacterium]
MESITAYLNAWGDVKNTSKEELSLLLSR